MLSPYPPGRDSWVVFYTKEKNARMSECYFERFFSFASAKAFEKGLVGFYTHILYELHF